jgi:hypothetical protein
MGNQKTFTGTEMACAVTSNFNVQRSTSNVQMLNYRCLNWALEVERSAFASDVEVPGRGLEPLRISPPDPKSGASANFATLAFQPIKQNCAQFTPEPDSRNRAYKSQHPGCTAPSGFRGAFKLPTERDSGGENSCRAGSPTTVV